MSDYREAYENYYKNINKTMDNSGGLKIKSKKKNYINIINNNYSYWTKRIIRESIGALVILLTLMLLKYIPLQKTNIVYNTFKNTIIKSITYDETIESMKNFEIGNFKGKDISINGFTLEDLKKEKLHEKVDEVMKYIQNNSNKSEEKEI